jgi:glycosyltransferase involved in cell wall biosynthesis
MTISGFSFIRNGEILGYPFVESLRSLLPLCDEIIVAVGNSDDMTREKIQNLSGNIRIIDTTWDDNNRLHGSILAEQTNIALSHCRGDWCIYLQADEVLHEQDYNLIKREMVNVSENMNVESLLFRWHHFFGSYNYTGIGRQWYRREIRAFKNSGKVLSWRDAQGFRCKDENGVIRKLYARQTEARIFHYGWVRHPRLQKAKQLAFHRLYHDDKWLMENIPQSDEFESFCYEVQPFTYTHPKVMQQRIESDASWTKNYDPTRVLQKPWAMAVTDYIEKVTGYRIGEYKNFIEV